MFLSLCVDTPTQNLRKFTKNDEIFNYICQKYRTIIMNILITNDDGYQAKGIKVLTELMKQKGNVRVIAPKTHQSGMSMAVSLGLKQIAYKEISNQPGEIWSYLDATPASCVKFGVNMIYQQEKLDVVVSGINHGSNASSASCYSGTLGAAQEGALCGILSIGVSLDNLHPDADFSAVEKFFPEIYDKILALHSGKYGIFYNINFPSVPAEEIKGVRVGYQGKGRWIKEFREWNPDAFKKYGLTPEMLGQSSVPNLEEGEELYVMVGEFLEDPNNTNLADHRLNNDGYISIVVHNLDTTDYEETELLKNAGLDADF